MIVLASQELAKFWNIESELAEENRFGSCDCSARQPACFKQRKQLILVIQPDVFLGNIEFIKERERIFCQNALQNLATADSSVS